LNLRKSSLTAVLLLHTPAAQHGHLEPPLLVLLRPQIEIADRHADDVARGRVFVRIAELHDIRFARVIDDALLEPFDLEHLHLHDEPPAGRVGALDANNRELQLGDVDALLACEVLHVEDAMLALKLEEVVEQRYKQRLARLGAEDPLEDEVGLGVSEDGPHEEVLRPMEALGNGSGA